MAKIKKATSKLPDRILTVSWPIFEHSKRDIRSNVLGVLDLLRAQLDNDAVTIFHIMMGNMELSGLIISYGVHSVRLNYMKDMERNTMSIIFLIPSPEEP